MVVKVKNRLLNFNLVIYQDDEWFKFSLDSVLLANFVTLNLRAKKVLDMATGNAPIPLLLSRRTKAKIYGIELQKCVFDLGIESVLENVLEDRVNLVQGDVRQLKNYFESESFDVVTCNPPYFKTKEDGYFNENSVKAMARHEVCLTLSEVLKNATFVLKNGGYFAMVHRTERFVEIIEKMKEFHLEPKRVQFIYPKIGRDSDLFLIEGVKNGQVGLKMLPPLVIHEVDGSYTKEISKLFEEVV